MPGHPSSGLPRLAIQVTFETPNPTQELFDPLFARRNEIEAQVGHPLTWLPKGDNGKRKRAVIRSFARADAKNAPPDLAAWGAQEYLVFAEVFPDYVDLNVAA